MAAVCSSRRKCRAGVEAAWLQRGLIALLWLAVAWPFAARADDRMEAETVELIHQVDHHPNQAVRDAEQNLQRAKASGDLAGQLRSWRVLALAHTELLDMLALREDIAGGQPLALKLGH